MRNAWLDEAQAGIKIVGRNINNLRYTHITTLMAESEEELKSLLMKLKEESEKVGLKLNIWKTTVQYSCLENPMDRGTWWATVPWGAESQTRLKRFSTQGRISDQVGSGAWRLCP